MSTVLLFLKLLSDNRNFWQHLLCVILSTNFSHLTYEKRENKDSEHYRPIPIKFV